MATYLMLFKFSLQGIHSVKSGPARLVDMKTTCESVGGKVRDFLLLMGQYDTALVVEAPDDETIARAALLIGARGNVHTESHRAFTEEEYQKLVDSLP